MFRHDVYPHGVVFLTNVCRFCHCPLLAIICVALENKAAEGGKRQRRPAQGGQDMDELYEAAVESRTEALVNAARPTAGKSRFVRCELSVSSP